MRPIYLFISYLAHNTDSNGGEFTYGGLLHKFETPATASEIQTMISDGLAEKFGTIAPPSSIQIMSITVLKKRVYKMLKGIR